MSMRKYIYTFTQTESIARYRAHQIITQAIITLIMDSPVPPETPPLSVSIAATRVTTENVSVLTEAQLILDVQYTITDRNTAANYTRFQGSGQPLSGVSGTAELHGGGLSYPIRTRHRRLRHNMSCVQF